MSDPTPRPALLLSTLPYWVAEACRRSPYRALGLASALGVGVGVVFGVGLGGRLVQLTVATAVATGLVELVRTLLREDEEERVGLDELGEGLRAPA